MVELAVEASRARVVAAARADVRRDDDDNKIYSYLL